MRFAAGCFASALVLLVAGGVGLTGSWALSVGAVSVLAAAVAAAVAMEERDPVAIEGLVNPIVGPGAGTNSQVASAPADVAALPEAA